jgi:hypothetical protein
MVLVVLHDRSSEQNMESMNKPLIDWAGKQTMKVSQW